MDSDEIACLGYDVTEPSSDFCDEKKSPIILLHGVTSTRETWNIFKQRIADKAGRKVYALDARNHGDSEWKELHSYHAMAKDVSHFMNKLHIPTAIVVGHSMGGKTAMMLATMEPNKVEKLAVEDISPKTLTPVFRRFPFFYLKLMKQSLEIVPRDSDLKTAKKKVFEYISDNTPEEHRSRTAIAREHAASTLALEKTTDGFRWKVNIEAIEKSVSGSPVCIDGKYNGPAVFIYGTRSVYDVMKDKDLIQECFPKATFVPVEGATHLVHYEYPEEFLKALLDFITE